MTRSEAQRRAVEAAAQWLHDTFTPSSNQVAEMTDAIAEYERAMADAGWRMVRDVGELNLPHIAHSITVPAGVSVTPTWLSGYEAGWNACRAAMLEDEA